MIHIHNICFVYQEIPEYIGNAEGNQIQLDDEGFTLISKLHHITNEELASMYNDDFELRVKTISNIVWFTFRFGDQGWGEAPFTLHLSAIQDKSNYMQYCQNFRFILIDTENGRVAMLMEIDIDQYGMNILETCLEETLFLPFDSISHKKLITDISSMFSVAQIAQASTPIFIS